MNQLLTNFNAIAHVLKSSLNYSILAGRLLAVRTIRCLCSVRLIELCSLVLQNVQVSDPSPCPG